MLEIYLVSMMYKNTPVNMRYFWFETKTVGQFFSFLSHKNQQTVIGTEILDRRKLRRTWSLGESTGGGEQDEFHWMRSELLTLRQP